VAGRLRARPASLSVAARVGVDGAFDSMDACALLQSGV